MDETEVQTGLGVLFVDDEKNILQALRRLFLDEDFEVYTAESGAEGLRLLESHSDIGLIVSDQRMPGMSGAEFLEHSRSIAPEAIRFILTGYADTQAAIDAINKGGAQRYISKPWNDDEMRRVVCEGLETIRLRRENNRLQGLLEEKNAELREWNDRLKSRVLQQTADIRHKNDELRGQNIHLKRNLRQTLEAFSRLLELRDEQTQDHSRQVAALAETLGLRLGWEGEELETLQTAALLHDIGKIGTPNPLLRKAQDHLDADELAEYMQHAVRGQTALDAIEGLREVGDLIRSHHEHFDGSGWPDGLRGEAIPLGARIIAICDQFVWRLNGPGEKTPEQVLATLRGLLGSQLDPQLFPALQGVVEEKYRLGQDKEEALEEHHLLPKQMCEGMILGENLFSGTGLLLLSKGTVLNKACIDSITRLQRLDPTPRPLTVWVKPEAETSEDD